MRATGRACWLLLKPALPAALKSLAGERSLPPSEIRDLARTLFSEISLLFAGEPVVNDEFQFCQWDGSILENDIVEFA